jgi:two-component system, LytTR family, sensor kinase
MLLIQMLEQMSTIAVAAFILSQSGILKNIIKDKLNHLNKISIIIFFSIISIIGTYTGIGMAPYALANTRPIGVIVSGYVGGPLVGIIVGAIAGFHRYTLGGFTAISCGIASVIEGLIGGLIRKYIKHGAYNIFSAAIAGIMAEFMQMLIILIISKPYKDALLLVQEIALPMIVVNSLGVVVFALIIKNAIEEHNRIGAIQAQKVLRIAKAATEYLKNGLDEKNAEKVAGIIKEMGNVNGVFLGNMDKILTHTGIQIETEILEKLYKNYLLNIDNEIIKYNEHAKEYIFLCTPIITSKGQLQGSIGLLVRSEKDIDKYFIEFSKEMSNLFATQIELNNLNKLSEALYLAELKALRSQIRPHFLFNALNTISSFCRTNPLKARELILNLSNYFRNTLKRENDFVTLGQELELIESYLYIEKARFGERLQLYIDIPEEFKSITIPIFVLQPIVENSVKHGIAPNIDGGNIFITVKSIGPEYLFSVKDTGRGMSKERYDEVVTKWPGIGLSTINERLKLLYGEKYKLNIKSTLGIGTEINFNIPVEGGKING